MTSKWKIGDRIKDRLVIQDIKHGGIGTLAIVEKMLCTAA